MTQEFRFCLCGTRLDSPVKKGRGRPESLCKDCSKANEAERNRRKNAKKAAEAKAVHLHISRRFNTKFSNKGSIACQSFLASLYEEIRSNNRCLPVKMRRAITNFVSPKGIGATMFSTTFGAFCRNKRGLKITNICDLNPTEEQLAEWKVLETAAKKADELMGIYNLVDYSCVEWLMRGFDDAVVEVIEDECGEFCIEDAVSNVVPMQKPQTLREIVLDYIRDGQDRGYTHLGTIIPAMVRRGHDRDDVVSVIQKLAYEQLIFKDEHDQLKLVKIAA